MQGSLSLAVSGLCVTSGKANLKGGEEELFNKGRHMQGDIPEL